jgi:hypothetical protein
MLHSCTPPRVPQASTCPCHPPCRILDAYAPAVGVAEAVDAKLQQLRGRLQEELKLQEALVAIQGCLEPILAASLSGLSLQD